MAASTPSALIELDRVGGLLKGDRDLGLVALREPGQDVVGAPLLRGRLADPDPHPGERVAVEVVLHGAEPVVAGEAATGLHAQLRDGQVELVVDDDDPLRGHAVAAHQPPHRVAEIVHPLLGHGQHDAGAADADLVGAGPFLPGSQAGAVARREAARRCRLRRCGGCARTRGPGCRARRRASRRGCRCAPAATRAAAAPSTPRRWTPRHPRPARQPPRRLRLRPPRPRRPPPRPPRR